MNCPFLIEGRDWEPVGEWPLVTFRDLAIVHDFEWDRCYEFRAGTKLIARAVPGSIILFCGYACDGYSPVIRRPRWVPGRSKWMRLTPTPRCGMFPAIIHDFFRQFCGVDRCPWDRAKADDWFFDALIAGRCTKEAGVYHSIVSGTIGDTFIALTRKPDPSLSITTSRFP